MALISASISDISEFSSSISLMVWRSSRDLAGIAEAIEALAAALSSIAVDFPKRPLEAACNKFESLVRWAEAMCDAPGNSWSKAYTVLRWIEEKISSNSGNKIFTNLAIEVLSFARSWTFVKR